MTPSELFIEVKLKINKISEMKINIVCRLILFGLFFLTSTPSEAQSGGFVNASEFGFSPDATGLENVAALQKAVDRTGTIIVATTLITGIPKEGTHFLQQIWIG